MIPGTEKVWQRPRAPKKPYINYKRDRKCYNCGDVDQNVPDCRRPRDDDGIMTSRLRDLMRRKTTEQRNIVYWKLLSEQSVHINFLAKQLYGQVEEQIMDAIDSSEDSDSIGDPMGNGSDEDCADNNAEIDILYLQEKSTAKNDDTHSTVRNSTVSAGTINTLPESMDSDDCHDPKDAKEERADGEIDEKPDSDMGDEHPDMADRRHDHQESNTILLTDTHPVIIFDPSNFELNKVGSKVSNHATRHNDAVSCSNETPTPQSVSHPLNHHPLRSLAHTGIPAPNTAAWIKDPEKNYADSNTPVTPLANFRLST